MDDIIDFTWKYVGRDKENNILAIPPSSICKSEYILIYRKLIIYYDEIIFSICWPRVKENELFCS